MSDAIDEATKLMLEGAEEIKKLTARNDELEDLLIMASAFKVSPMIHVEERGGGKWCVTSFGDVLNIEGEWEYEPAPSGRDEAFLERTRFDRATALRLAKEKANEQANKRRAASGNRT